MKHPGIPPRGTPGYTIRDRVMTDFWNHVHPDLLLPYPESVLAEDRAAEEGKSKTPTPDGVGA